MAKKLNRSEKIRRYITAHPTMSIKDIAAKFDTTYQIVYMVKRNMQKNALVDKVTMTSKEAELANKVGVSTVEYAKQKAKIIKDPLSNLPKVGDSVGGLTLTREEKDGKWVYTWVRDDVAKQKSDPVNHPSHYKTGGIETIDFIEAKGLNYNTGNAVKYISRAEHKGNKKQDLEKAVWYLNREISKL